MTPDSLHPGLDRRQLLRGAAGGALTGTAAALLGALPRAARAAGDPLQVGGLPVTCNLTLPVACTARAAANGAIKSGGPQFEFEYSKYNGWPEIKESLMTG
ncbi:MAG: nitrate ABC transporter substrate-binding protein, partial [Betaproteobacteria bacterium]